MYVVAIFLDTKSNPLIYTNLSDDDGHKSNVDVKLIKN